MMSEELSKIDFIKQKVKKYVEENKEEGKKVEENLESEKKEEEKEVEEEVDSMTNLETSPDEIIVEASTKKKKFTKKNYVDEIKKLQKLNGEEILPNNRFKSMKKKECEKMLADMIKKQVKSKILNEDKIVNEIQEETNKKIQSIEMGALALFNINRTLLYLVAQANNRYQKNKRYHLDKNRIESSMKEEEQTLMSAYSQIYDEYKPIVDKYLSPTMIIAMSNFKILVTSIKGVEEDIDVDELKKYAI